MTDDFSFMSEPAEPRPTKSGIERGGIIVFSAAALNSIELSIRELIAIEPILQSPMMEFIDGDGVVEEPNAAEIQMFKERNKAMGAPELGIAHTPEIDETREAIFNELTRHASLARSLGESCKFADYVAACKREGMIPLGLRDYLK